MILLSVIQKYHYFEVGGKLFNSCLCSLFDIAVALSIRLYAVEWGNHRTVPHVAFAGTVESFSAGFIGTIEGKSRSFGAASAGWRTPASSAMLERYWKALLSRYW